MLADKIDKNETLRGYSMFEDGTHFGYTELKTIEDVANFIVSDGNDKIITNELDQTVITTFNIYINKIVDKEYRNELLPILIPLQEGILKNVVEKEGY